MYIMLATVFSDILVRATECAGSEGDTGGVADADISVWVKDFGVDATPPPPHISQPSPTPIPQQTVTGIAHCYYNSCLL